MHFIFNNRKVPIKIEKSRRKTIAINIVFDGSVLVKAPSFMTDEAIGEFLMKKSSWISKKLQEVASLDLSSMKVRFKDGSTFSYLGQEVTLTIENITSKVCMVKKQENKLVVYTNSDDEDFIRQLVNKWYRLRAQEIINERVRYFSHFVNEKAKSVTIRNQKTRWGSCTSGRGLNFNYRLVMMPPEILDYVVVHELCHLKHMNHSREFWAEVERILPDMKIRKKWLKDNGDKYNL